VIGLVLALAPLHRAFGVRTVMVTTMQALSGAGYPGPSAIDLLGNVVPFISGEEDKVETEPRKILGTLVNGGTGLRAGQVSSNAGDVPDDATGRDAGPTRIEDASMRISAHTNRVDVEDGHMECVSVELGRKASVDEAIAALQNFEAEPQQLSLPSAPKPPVIVKTDDARPQPRLDRDAGEGMAAVVGRVRPCPVFDLRFVVLSHNTIRGAAGAAILNAELMHARGLLG
jgi:aspartate-semialdehyde dehydrogenase